MAEGDTTEAVVTTTTEASTQTQTQEQPQIGSFVNPDGTFKEGWQEALVDETFRGRSVYSGLTDLKSVMKHIGNADTLIGRKGLKAPDDNASPQEWDAYYKLVGRPDKPGDYKVEIPKEMESYYDQTLLDEAKAELHKAGLTQKQVAAVMALDGKRIRASLAQVQAQAESQRVEAEKTLRSEWGKAYDERLHNANRVIAENVSEEDKPEILQAIGNNPKVAKLLASVGMKFMEHKVIQADSATHAMTPTEAKNRQNELIQQLVKTDSMSPAYKRLNAEIDELAKYILQAG